MSYPSSCLLGPHSTESTFSTPSSASDALASRISGGRIGALAGGSGGDVVEVVPLVVDETTGGASGGCILVSGIIVAPFDEVTIEGCTWLSFATDDGGTDVDAETVADAETNPVSIVAGDF